MKWANLPLIILLIASVGVLTFAQGPGPDDRTGGPPPQGERDRDDMGPRRDDWRGPDKPMDAQQLLEAMEVLKKIDPEKAEKLQQALDKNPDRVGQVINENFPHLGRFMSWRKYDPEGFDLRVEDMALSRQTHECAKRLREALDKGDDEIAAIEEVQLRELVTEHFDIRQQIREHDLVKLKEKIAELLEQLEDRLNKRESIIDERIEELIKGEDDYRW